MEAHGVGIQGAAPEPSRLRPVRDFPYEYEHERLAIDLINGSEQLRLWVDDSNATPADLELIAAADEQLWREECSALLGDFR